MNEKETYQNVSGNRKYKDSLFRMLFQKEKDLLDLYNAINGTAYTDPEDLEIPTPKYIVFYNGLANELDHRGA